MYLQDSHVKVELTATERVGIHRYTFPQSDNARFLLDLAHAGDASTDAANPDAPPTPSIRGSSLKIVGNDTIVGGRCTDIWAKRPADLFLHEVSKPFDSADIYSDGKLIDGIAGEQKGTALRCVLKFKTKANEVGPVS